jgi:WD40 repeat protein
VWGEKCGFKTWPAAVPLRFFSAEYCGNVRWTPDGSEITVTAREGSKVRNFLVPRLGGSPHQIESRPDSWSPDGSHYASIGQPRDGRIEIRTVDKTTGRSTSFNLAGPFIYAGGVDWSPSGDRMLILAIMSKNIYSIWTVKTDGSQQNMAIEDNVILSSPKWAPKGDAIFYLRGQIGSPLTEL